ncbi:MAG: carboxypeptidase regulatory-like domain-containing protein [Thermoplasmata archaeon]
MHRGTTAGLLMVGLAFLVIVATACGAYASTSARPGATTITVSGNITDAQSGLPVAGAAVSSNLGASTTSNATGGYTLNVPAGSFTIGVFCVGYHGTSRALTLRSSTAGENIPIAPYTFPVRGTVVEKTSALPISGASVLGPFHLSAITSSTGQFTFLLENGTFSLTVSALNFQTNTLTVTVNGTTQTPFFLMIVNGTSPPDSLGALSGPGTVLGAGVVVGTVTGVAAYVLYLRREARRFPGAPLAGLPSQQTDDEAAHPRNLDRRNVRRRR